MLAREQLASSLARFGHRLAVAINMGPSVNQTVGSSLLPLRLPQATTLQRPKPGPVLSALSHGSATLLQSHAKATSMNTATHAPSNLSPSAYRTLRTLRDRVDIVVRPADKNLGVTVMSKAWYVKAALQHLSDSDTYARIGCASPEMINARLRDLQAKLTDILSEHLAAPTLRRLMAGPFRLARFYCIPKLHKHDKKPLDARPITSQSGAPTEVASVMLAGLLNGILGLDHWWALRDTTSLINHMEDIVLPVDDPLTGRTTWLISSDVTALYPNMDIPRMRTVVHAAVGSYIEAHRHAPLDPIPDCEIESTCSLVPKLTRFVLTNCVFTFDSGNGEGPVMYEQRKGAAMGAACVPPIANLYMADLVRTTVCTWKARVGGPHLVTAKGFIDDILSIFFGTQLEAETYVAELNGLHPAVKLTSVLSTTSVPFLDLEVFRQPGSNKLLVKPYVKVLNRFLYIPPWSGHAPHMLGSFIAGECKRLVRNSSVEGDAVISAAMFMAHLLERGYQAQFVLKEFSRVSYRSRPKLLHPPPKPRVDRPVVALTLPYNPVTASLPLGSVVRAVQKALDECHEQVTVRLGWTNERNLQSLLHLQWPKD